VGARTSFSGQSGEPAVDPLEIHERTERLAQLILHVPKCHVSIDLMKCPLLCLSAMDYVRSSCFERRPRVGQRDDVGELFAIPEHPATVVHFKSTFAARLAAVVQPKG
jgi:hypothetical protein